MYIEKSRGPRTEPRGTLDQAYFLFLDLISENDIESVKKLIFWDIVR